MNARVLFLSLALLSPVQALDDAARDAVQGLRRPWLERPFAVLNAATRPVWVFGSLVTLAALDGVAGAGTVRAALIAMAGTNLVVEGMKRATFRARPDGEHKRSNSSFPSGHASTSFALAWVLARRYRRAAPLLYLLALAVSFSRMYLNRHWLSDVTVGAGVGLLCGWLTTRFVPAWARHERPQEAPSPTAAASP